MAYFNINKH